MNIDFAVPYTAKSGKAYKPGDSAELPEGEARRVIETGYGRLAEADKANTKAKSDSPAAKTEGK